MFIRTENAVKSFDTEFTCTMLCCCVVWGQNGAGRVCHFARQVRLGAPCSLARALFFFQPTGTDSSNWGVKILQTMGFWSFLCFTDVARTQATRGHPKSCPSSKVRSGPCGPGWENCVLSRRYFMWDSLLRRERENLEIFATQSILV